MSTAVGLLPMSWLQYPAGNGTFPSLDQWVLGIGLRQGDRAGGPQESEAVLDLAASLPTHEWAVSSHHLVNRLQAPRLLLLYRLLEDAPRGLKA